MWVCLTVHVGLSDCSGTPQLPGAFFRQRFRVRQQHVQAMPPPSSGGRPLLRLSDGLSVRQAAVAACQGEEWRGATLLQYMREELRSLLSLLASVEYPGLLSLFCTEL